MCFVFSSTRYQDYCLEKHSYLSPMSSAVLQLCRIFIPLKQHVVFMDNAFSTIYLIPELQKMSIGAVGTTRINSAELPDSIKDKTMTTWNSLTGCNAISPNASSRKSLSGEDVVCQRWEDNKIVQRLTTVHYCNEYRLDAR